MKKIIFLIIMYICILLQNYIKSTVKKRNAQQFTAYFHLKLLRQKCIRKILNQCKGENFDLVFATTHSENKKFASLEIQSKEIDLRNEKDFSVAKIYIKEQKITSAIVSLSPAPNELIKIVNDKYIVFDAKFGFCDKELKNIIYAHIKVLKDLEFKYNFYLLIFSFKSKGKEFGYEMKSNNFHTISDIRYRDMKKYTEFQNVIFGCTGNTNIKNNDKCYGEILKDYYLTVKGQYIYSTYSIMRNYYLSFQQFDEVYGLIKNQNGSIEENSLYPDDYVNVCQNNPCLNGAECQQRNYDHLKVINCLCGNKYFGTLCEHHRKCPQCYDNNCNANGECIKCPFGWNGNDCEIRRCPGKNPCIHGTCSLKSNKRTCNCNTGWTGRLCSIDCVKIPKCSQGKSCFIEKCKLEKPEVITALEDNKDKIPDKDKDSGSTSSSEEKPKITVQEVDGFKELFNTPISEWHKKLKVPRWLVYGAIAFFIFILLIVCCGMCSICGCCSSNTVVVPKRKRKKHSSSYY